MKKTKSVEILWGVTNEINSKINFLIQEQEAKGWELHQILNIVIGGDTRHIILIFKGGR